MQIEPVVWGQDEKGEGGGYTVCALSSGLAAAVNDDTSEEIYVDAALPLVLEGVPSLHSLPPQRAQGKQKNLHLNSLKFSKLTH